MIFPLHDYWDTDKAILMTSHWQKVLFDYWNISSSLTRLNGEYDLNFMAMTAAGEGYVLKVMRPGCDAGLVEMQCAALEHINLGNTDVPTPNVIWTTEGRPFLEVCDENGEERLVWVLQRMNGMTYADFRPHSRSLATELGHQIALMDKALTGFDHPYLAREFKWKLPAGDWIKNHLDVIKDANRRTLISEILAEFEVLRPALAAMPEVAIHSDMNDYNVLVTASLDGRHSISGIVDFGDMVVSPRVCELAIAGAYVVLEPDKPEAMLAALVAGYHAAYSLETVEIDMIWPLLNMRLAVSVINSTLEAAENPDDSYITISQAPAWRFLHRNDIAAGAIRARLRSACGVN